MKGDKHWPNTCTEVEDLGNGKFAASISVGHRVFFDKTDGNKPKRHKLTDKRPSKGYVLIQGAKCCVEVYPYYAKYFDVQHKKVRLYEERWVVQRLFKAPDKWRDVDAYNPVMTVEEYPELAGDVVKVTVTYDTDYGKLIVEYFQRDGNALKHNVTFKNTSGSTETFRVVQAWAGIVGAKCNGKDSPANINTPFLAFHKADKPSRRFTIAENARGIMKAGLQDILEMLTGDREPVVGEEVLVDSNGIKLTVAGYYAHLWIDGKEVMISIEQELSSMVRAVEDCPDNARVFIGGLGLGVILLPLFLSDKSTEVIVCEKDQRVIDNIAPLVQEYFGKRLNLRIIQGDAAIEVSQQGKFDWIFMDFFYGDEINEANEEWLRNLSIPNLNTGGVYTSYSQAELHRETRVPYLRPVSVNIHSNGMKADFIYSRWLLSHDEKLEIDPDTATLDDPTEDGDIKWDVAYARDNTGTTITVGVSATRGSWLGDWRGYVEWPISTLAGKSLSANPIFKYHGAQYQATDLEINPITSQPSVAADADLYADMCSGVAYVDPFNMEVGENKQVDLGASAKSNLQAAMDVARSWWAIGECSPADEGGTEAVRYTTIWSEEKTDAANPKPTLYVEFTLAGWTGKISGVTDPAKIMGVDVANIAKVKGVA